ncbi:MULTISPECIES: single-stranded DNA-binding protein [unclassified Brevibacterium]|uniref:single-stranded DNA-binding protein n=1 Tax=unclassified Brevibacterium TaxID=2614124 RepID=UPI001E38C908|nr:MULTISPECIES: single-stranded DNA-binding protein [unclassified Brevibacterium]MCD1287302.1 hypothetical protein [Brevibacterium sp. CCUG 69071]MDK8436442.1 single-stranded DNA-binding protein [Brevibacterium sp. H-BE7]
MADARVTIEGGIVADPRFNTTNSGKHVANLTIRAGRSKKNDDGSYEQLSSTAYDVTFWGEHADLVSALNPEKGSQVTVSGTITELASYDGQNGQSLSAKVNGDGIRVYPKRQQGGGVGQQSSGGNFGGHQSQQGGWGNQQQTQQSSGWGQNPSQGGGGDGSEPPF